MNKKPIEPYLSYEIIVNPNLRPSFQLPLKASGTYDFDVEYAKKPLCGKLRSITINRQPFPANNKPRKESKTMNFLKRIFVNKNDIEAETEKIVESFQKTFKSFTDKTDSLQDKIICLESILLVDDYFADYDKEASCPVRIEKAIAKSFKRLALKHRGKDTLLSAFSTINSLFAGSVADFETHYTTAENYKKFKSVIDEYSDELKTWKHQQEVEKKKK